MAVKIKRIGFWSGRIEDRAGGAAEALGKLAAAKAALEFVLARRTPEDPGRGVLFVSPVDGKKAQDAAQAAGLAPATAIAGLRVEGPDRPGTGGAIARAIADAGVSFRGMTASVFGKHYVCTIAFDRAEDADKAAAALKSLK